MKKDKLDTIKEQLEEIRELNSKNKKKNPLEDKFAEQTGVAVLDVHLKVPVFCEDKSELKEFKEAFENFENEDDPKERTLELIKAISDVVFAEGALAVNARIKLRAGTLKTLVNEDDFLDDVVDALTPQDDK